MQIILIRALYIRILTRQPSPDELKKILSLDPQSQDQTVQRKFYSSVAWALVNSNEFLFNH